MPDLERVLVQADVEFERVERLEVTAGPPLFVVHAARQRETFDRLRELVPLTERWPVAVEVDRLRWFLDDLCDLDATRQDPHEIVEQGLALDPEAWFRERAAELEEDDSDGWMPEAGDFEPDALAVTQDLLSQRPGPILLPGTPKSWEVAAYIWYGGRNECPAPDEHVAVHRWWYERFGAELECLSNDTIVLRVERPPAEEDTARAVALEYFLYDPDAVWQGTETLGRLATEIAASRRWLFWWD